MADTTNKTGRLGVIEDGAECPRVRFDDGSVFSLEKYPGQRSRLKPGTRVRVSGNPLGPSAISRCQQGRAFIATAIDIL